MNAQLRVLAARTLVAEFRTAQGDRRENLADQIVRDYCGLRDADLAEFLEAGGGVVLIEFERLVRYSCRVLTHVSPTAH